MPISVEDHVAERRNLCPYCGDRHVFCQGLELELDYDNRRAISQRCSCLSCHGRWTNVYRLDRYTPTYPPD